VADPARRLGFVADRVSGVVAVDRDTGSVRWRTDAISRPLLVVGDLFVGLAPPTKPPSPLRIVALDIRLDGQLSTLSDPIALTESVADAASAIRDPRIENGLLLIDWEVQGRYTGGAPPPPSILQQARTISAGSARVDLHSGRVQANHGRSSTQPPCWVERDPSAEPWAVGDKHAQLAWSESDGELLLGLTLREDAGRSHTVKLGSGTGLVPRVTPDGTYIFLHTEGGDERQWRVFGSATGERVATLTYEAGARFPTVLDERVYFVVERPRELVLKARELASDSVVWELALSSPPMMSPPSLRQ
jgi:hypothetical protein